MPGHTTTGPRGFWMDAPLAVEPLRTRQIPLLLAACSFAAGILLAHWHWHTAFELVWTTLLLLLLSVASLWKAPRLAWLPALALAAATGCWCAHVEPPVPSQAQLLRYADGLRRTVRGTVVQVRPVSAPTADGPDMAHPPAEPWLAEPGAWEPEAGHPHASLDLQTSAVEDVTPDISTMRHVRGGVRFSLYGAAPALHCGDEIDVQLRLRQPDVYRDPGAWSPAEQLLSEGIGVLGSAGTSTRPPALHVLRRGQPDWRCRLHAAQSWASARLAALPASETEQRLPAALRLTPGDAAILAAMLFGDRSLLGRAVRTGFERTGTFHLFVVSGLHIVLLASGLLWLLRRLRLPYAAAVLVSLSVAVAYALLSGWGVPVQRALGMTALFLLARLLARKAGALNALGAAAMAILVLSPSALYTASFQMTFLALLAIAGLAAPLEARGPGLIRDALQELRVVRLDVWLHPRLASLRVWLRLWSDLFRSLVSPAVQSRLRTIPARLAGSLPVVAARMLCLLAAAVLTGVVAECCLVLPMVVYFHRATPAALPVNLLCLPLIGVLLCAAVLTFALLLLSTKLAVLPAMLAAAMLHAVRTLVAHAGSSPAADLRVPAPAVPLLVTAGLLLAMALMAVRARRRLAVGLGLAAIAVVPVLALAPEPPLIDRGQLEVTAIDVGQGDSLLVVSPDGHTLLVDGGGPVGQPLPTPDGWDIGEEVVAPYLWSRRLRRLDAVLLTHAHSDHMGGLPAVLRDLHPRELWLGVQPGESPGLLALRQEAQDLGTRVRWFHAGDAFTWGGVQAEVLAPEPGYTNPGAAINDDSLVMRLAYGRASVLLEGDAEAASEAAMLLHGRVQTSTLLKIGHHGSKTSTTPSFLAAVAPRDAVISVGRNNVFGHPRMEVLQRLEQAGVKTVRTDRAGLETFLLTADGGVTTKAGSQ